MATILGRNYGGETAFGIWGAGWCPDPDSDEVKEGTRPDEPAPFDPLPVWSFDSCDLTTQSQVEVRARAERNLRLIEQTAIEREFSARLIADAPAGPAPADIVAAVGHLEAELAKTNTLGHIHASAQWAAAASAAQLVVPTRAGLRTPLGHTWVFGGGYVEGLGKALVATSPTYGWRNAVELRDAIDDHHPNTYLAIAERSVVVVGYEKAVAIVWLT